MYHYPESSYSRISDIGPGSDYELAFLPLAASSNSKKSQNVEELELLDATETVYSSDYGKGKRPLLRNPGTDRLLGEVRQGSNIGRYFRLHDREDVGTPFRGWRKAVIAAAIVTGFVLLVNVIFTIIARIKFDAQDGVGLIYRGNCDLVKRWDTAMHLLINLLGTALLAASSFTMQCLSSPTRSEVNVAHTKRVPLDIGLQSFKNLFHVKLWKGVLWSALCLSTLPLHLLWNSTIFSTTGTNLFSAVVVSEAFLDGAYYQKPNISAQTYCQSAGTVNLTDTIDTIRTGYKANNYLTLSATDCLNSYTGTYLSLRRNLIMVVKRQSPTIKMSKCGYNGQFWNGSSVIAMNTDLAPGYNWLTQIIDYSQSLKISDLQAEANEKGTLTLGNYTVTSCLAESVQVSQCQLQFVSYILYVVVACNLVKFASMCIAAHYLWNLDEPILATVGDATSSFLEHPDITTKGFCLLDLQAVNAGVWKRGLTDTHAYNPTYNRKLKRRLYSATTSARWWWTMILCTLYLIAGFVLWYLSLRDLARYEFGETMKLKFGAVDSGLVLGLPGQSGAALITDVVVANSFQLALSTTYFLYNSLYSAQCAALEWGSYVQGKLKSLRVTWPRGQQRSTYYLQLPYRYGIPLTILLILMHFLISQSIFLARLQQFDSRGNPTSGGFSDVGFSPRATLTTCLVGAAMILAQIVHACRPLENRIPIHGNNSAVISAMCHAEFDDGTSKLRKYSSNTQVELGSVATRPITWGVIRRPAESHEWNVAGPADVESRNEVGHCSFSAEMVELPEVGKKYR